MHSQHDGADSDSDWDSTLDFTSPRQTGPHQTPHIQLTEEEDNDDYSRNESVISNKDRPKPKERIPVPANQPVPPVKDDEDASVNSNLYATVQKGKNGNRSNQGTPRSSRAALGERDGDPPPYNFRGALNGAITPDKQRTAQPPGRDQKEGLYDTVAFERAPSPHPAPSPAGKRALEKPSDSINSMGSWDDSDQDERTLRELRENFRQEKQKEQQAEDLKLKLQREAELEKLDEGQMTNRSEATWKSWASGGRGKKKNPASSRNKAMKSESAAAVTREHRIALKAETPRTNREVALAVGQGQVIEPKFIKAETQPESRIEAVSPAKDIAMESPAYIDPPFIVKDEDGRSVYYFGHGSLQYYEVEDDASAAFMPRIAEKAEIVLQRIYQEFFGLLRIITSVVILLIVELMKYIIKYIIQPLIVGVFGTMGDYIAKPVFSLAFNGFVHPFGVFMWNCFMTLRHMFSPISEILRKVFIQLAMLCRSIRCVEIHWKTNRSEERITDLTQV
ncbi:uncharacterized protein LOC110455234 [Mizuhopecten yessoensis]|uniref:Uncharacterized protein n=1 Tax=Mizuhopecten yessoensis TaxID=6573 RepID=A0A210QDD5_MIZYE|nr:uncharacterized protein LOC110455234 [Mizuhopecten yessoensis]OWF46763.1 hypothetical protein KP79_PYT18875 [Mizuhopecten yessoensis]